jgi:hypothetical protein
MRPFRKPKAIKPNKSYSFSCLYCSKKTPHGHFFTDCSIEFLLDYLRVERLL